MVKTLISDHALVDKRSLDTEVAMTLKMKGLFPDLPDEVMMRLIPRLEQVKAEHFGNQLPWNRHKKRKLLKAKNVVLHMLTTSAGNRSARVGPPKCCASIFKEMSLPTYTTRMSTTPTCCRSVPQDEFEQCCWGHHVEQSRHCVTSTKRESRPLRQPT